MTTIDYIGSSKGLLLSTISSFGVGLIVIFYIVVVGVIPIIAKVTILIKNSEINLTFLDLTFFLMIATIIGTAVAIIILKNWEVV